MIRRSEIRRHSFCNLGSLEIQLVGTFGKIILSEHYGCSTEAIGLDHITPRLKIVLVNILNGGWLGDHQVLVASVQVLAAKVVGCQLLALNVSASRSVKDDYLFLEYVEKCFHDL